MHLKITISPFTIDTPYWARYFLILNDLSAMSKRSVLFNYKTNFFDNTVRILFIPDPSLSMFLLTWNPRTNEIIETVTDLDAIILWSDTR